MWFHAYANDKVYKKRDTLSLSLSLLSTLSETGVEGPGPIQVEAVCEAVWLHAEVYHLVEAELAAVNGSSLWFQSNEELLRTVRGHQASLRGTRETE